jgi:glucose-6-phosphate 1-dehydrogenase
VSVWKEANERPWNPAKRTLISGLCNLAQSNLLPHQFAIIGFSDENLTADAFRLQLSDHMKEFETNPAEDKQWGMLHGTHVLHPRRF